MNIFRQRLQHYKQVQQEKREGKIHYISFKKYYPRFSKFVPGIFPGTGYMIGAASGVGKSKLARHMFLKVPYDFIKTYPNSGLSIKIILNALEETKEEVADALIVQRLREVAPHAADVMELNGYSDMIVDNELLKVIEDNMAYFDDLDKYLDVVNISQPTGFYKYVREYAKKHGTFYYKGVAVQIPENADWSKLHWDTYKPFNPNELVICMSDHIWLYDAEGTETKHKTLENFSANYCRKMINNKFGYTTVNIQQFYVSSEQEQFTMKGQSIVSKLEPSLESFGDVKTTVRDNLVILGLFSPARHNLTDHRGYDINKLGDRYRGLFIMKNRKGRGENLFVPMFFDGSCDLFREMPTLDEKDRLHQVYEYVKTLEK